jgi:hypothetical protein
MKATLAALALTAAFSIAAAPQMPAAAQAEMDKLAALIPQVRNNPAEAAIIAAKGTGQFTTDGKEPQFIRSKEMNMSGKIQKAVAMDGVIVGSRGTRTAEDQRFLEMNNLVKTYVLKAITTPRNAGSAPSLRTSADNDRKVYRNRVRYVAKALNADISNLELFWSKEDVMSDIENTKADVAALQAELARLRRQGDASAVEINDLQNKLRHAQDQ